MSWGIFNKILIVLLSVIMTFSLASHSYAGRCFVRSSGNVNGREVLVGYKFNFGSQPDNEKNNDYLGKLKQEDTAGAGSAIGLIILGGCILAAAILIINKVDDVTDDTDDKTDELQDWAEEQYEDIKDNFVPGRCL